MLDPAEPKKIFDFLNSKNLSLEGILITHHHSDHTQGIGEFKTKIQCNGLLTKKQHRGDN